jgi:hypothetical protein
MKMKKTIFALIIACLSILFLPISVSAATYYNSIYWEQTVGRFSVTPYGFGDNGNQSPRSMAVYGGELYVATDNNNGMQIWHSSDGFTWIPAVGPGAAMPAGFGVATHSAAGPLIVFNGMLLAAVGDATTGCQVWSTTDGINWTQEVGGPGGGTSNDGFGDINNMYISSGAVFAGNLYFATTNSIGGSQLFSSANGHAWNAASTAGYGHPNNESTYDVTPFGGSLYASTYDYTTPGASIFSSSDGTTWASSVGYAPSLIGPGFDNPNNWGLNLAVFNGSLYAVSRPNGGGTDMWRTTDGIIWEHINFGIEGPVYSMLADSDFLLLGMFGMDHANIMGSKDGLSWYLVNPYMLSDGGHDVRSLVRFGDYIYGGTYTNFSSTGTEIWRATVADISWLLDNPTYEVSDELPYSGR